LGQFDKLSLDNPVVWLGQMKKTFFTYLMERAILEREEVMCIYVSLSVSDPCLKCLLRLNKVDNQVRGLLQQNFYRQKLNKLARFSNIFFSEFGTNYHADLCTGNIGLAFFGNIGLG
jgi:hypothetical protein